MNLLTKTTAELFINLINLTNDFCFLFFFILSNNVKYRVRSGKGKYFKTKKHQVSIPVIDNCDMNNVNVNMKKELDFWSEICIMF